MSEARFAEIMASAVDDLPEALRDRLDNVELVWSDWPSRDQLDRTGVAPGHTLFGLYEGVPLTGRSASYGMVLPDKITVFRGPILAACATEDDVRRQVQRTVFHELAHHFGIGDERLDEIGAY